MKLDNDLAHLVTLRVAQVWHSFRFLGDPSWTGSTPCDWLLRPASSLVPPPIGPSISQFLFGQLHSESQLHFESPFGVGDGFDTDGLLASFYRQTGLRGIGFGQVGSMLVEDMDSVGILRRGEPTRHVPVGVTVTADDFAGDTISFISRADFVVLDRHPKCDGGIFEVEELQNCLKEVDAARRTFSGSLPPILLKLQVGTISDLEQARMLSKTAQSSGTVDGFVVSSFDNKFTSTPSKEKSNQVIRAVFGATEGKVPIIGVGGVETAEAAYEMIRSGASLIGVCTGLMKKGPALFFDLHLGLRRLLDENQYSSIVDIIGLDAPCEEGI